MTRTLILKLYTKQRKNVPLINWLTVAVFLCQVSIEVPQFTPDELKVRVSQEGQLLEVEGKHAERADEHGLVSRHFVR